MCLQDAWVCMPNQELSDDSDGVLTSFWKMLHRVIAMMTGQVEQLPYQCYRHDRGYPALDDGRDGLIMNMGSNLNPAMRWHAFEYGTGMHLGNHEIENGIRVVCRQTCNGNFICVRVDTTSVNMTARESCSTLQQNVLPPPQYRGYDRGADTGERIYVNHMGGPNLHQHFVPPRQYRGYDRSLSRNIMILVMIVVILIAVVIVLVAVIVCSSCLKPQTQATDVTQMPQPHARDPTLRRKLPTLSNGAPLTRDDVLAYTARYPEGNPFLQDPSQIRILKDESQTPIGVGIRPLHSGDSMACFWLREQHVTINYSEDSIWMLSQVAPWTLPWPTDPQAKRQPRKRDAPHPDLPSMEVLKKRRL